MRGRRIKHRKRKVEVIKIDKINQAKDCTCSVSYSSCGKPSLVLHVEIFSNTCNTTKYVNFQLSPRTKIELHHVGCTPYAYRIKWKMGKMRYQLKVSKLSLISSLIHLNRLFDVRHILK